jgi:anti-anti-sigma factor
MEIREVQEGDVLVLAPDGNLASADDCSALEAKLVAVLKKGVRFIVVDCADVVQLRAPAIRALLQASRKLGRAEGRVVLCAMNAKVQKAFAISGFDRDFTVVPSREDAVRRVVEPVGVASPRPLTTVPGSPARAEDAPAVAPPVGPGPEVEPAPGPAVGPPPAHDIPVVVGPSSDAPPAGALAGPPFEALVTALLGALGGREDRLPAAARPDGAAPTDVNVLAGLVLAALSARPA